MYTPSTTGSALKTQFFIFWGLIMTKLHDFSYPMKRWSYKVSWLLKITVRIDLLWVLYDMHASQTTGSTPKISRKLYIILNWLKDREIHLSITVIYTSRTKGNGLKWEFRSSFEWDFQDFLRNLIYYNLHANRKESKENQLLH